MVEFTFDNLFHTTNKGLPDTSNLPPYSYITMNHFVYSLIVQIILALVITIYTGLAVYRAFYRIKNTQFNDGNDQTNSEEHEQSNQENQSQKDHQKDEKHSGQQASQTNDNLIYRFDEEQSQKDSKQDGKEEEQNDDDNKGENDQQEEEEQQQVSEETTQWFLDMDHKMLFFHPFLISFVIVCNIFASNIMVLLLLGLTLIFFFLFNIKGYCSKKPILQIVFTLPCVVVLLMVFFEDKDMST